MATYKNQINIKIGELQPPLEHQSNDGELFLKALNWTALRNVMSDLTDPEFKLWIYLQQWRGKGNYEFSPANLHILFGWSDNSARKYKDGLERKDYLVMIGKNLYQFIPYPLSLVGRAAIFRETNRENLSKNLV